MKQVAVATISKEAGLTGGTEDSFHYMYVETSRGLFVHR